MNIHIRPAQPSDLAALLEIEERSFNHPRWHAADFFPGHPNDRCLVAESDRCLAALLVVREIFPGDALTRPEREILNVATHPDFRRQRIATRLLEHELASGAIYFLEVRESNHAAQSLYRLLGFVEVSRRPDYYSHPTETAIVMSRK